MNALPIARLFGFEIRVHVSWAIILAVIGVTAATQATRIAPEIGTTGGWIIGAVVAAAFLLSALAHELGHALAARHVGLPGGPVIVYFFGGAATSRPRDDPTARRGPRGRRRTARQPGGRRRLHGRWRWSGSSPASGPLLRDRARRPGHRRHEPPARRGQPAAGVPARWRPHRPRPGVGPDGRSVARPEHRGLVRALSRDPVRDRRHRRHPHRRFARRADARGVRLVHRLERQRGRAQRRRRRDARRHQRGRRHGPRRVRRPAGPDARYVRRPDPRRVRAVVRPGPARPGPPRDGRREAGPAHPARPMGRTPAPRT